MNYKVEELKAAFQTYNNDGNVELFDNDPYLIEVWNDDDNIYDELSLGQFNFEAEFCGFKKTYPWIYRQAKRLNDDELKDYIETKGNRWYLRNFDSQGDILNEYKIVPLCINDGYVYFTDKTSNVSKDNDESYDDEEEEQIQDTTEKKDFWDIYKQAVKETRPDIEDYMALHFHLAFNVKEITKAVRNELVERYYSDGETESQYHSSITAEAKFFFVPLHNFVMRRINEVFPDAYIEFGVIGDVFVYLTDEVRDDGLANGIMDRIKDKMEALLTDTHYGDEDIEAPVK